MARRSVPRRIMPRSASGFARDAARETSVLAIAMVGAFLFFIHGSLYLQAGSAGRPVTLEGFLLVTAILYLFLRLIFVVAGLYFPRPRRAYAVCPKCGRTFDATTPARRRRVAVTPRPSEKEDLAAIMLRRAIDDARRSARKDLSGPRSRVANVPGEVENPVVSPEEFERILRQLDASRLGRGPGDRGPRGPPGPPP